MLVVGNPVKSLGLMNVRVNQTFPFSLELCVCYAAMDIEISPKRTVLPGPNRVLCTISSSMWLTTSTLNFSTNSSVPLWHPISILITKVSPLHLIRGGMTEVAPKPHSHPASIIKFCRKRIAADHWEEDGILDSRL